MKYSLNIKAIGAFSNAIIIVAMVLGGALFISVPAVARDWGQLFDFKRKMLKEIDVWTQNCQSGMTRECYKQKEELEKKLGRLNNIRVPGVVSCKITEVDDARRDGEVLPEAIKCVAGDDLEVYEVYLFSKECRGKLKFEAADNKGFYEVRMCVSDRLFVGDRVSIKGNAISISAVRIDGNRRMLTLVIGGEFGGAVEVKLLK